MSDSPRVSGYSEGRNELQVSAQDKPIWTDLECMFGAHVRLGGDYSVGVQRYS